MQIQRELLEGYRRFRTGRFAQEAERYRALAKGQRPKTMVIGCADSRVDPAAIFSAGPGELFVVRNVAALVHPCEHDGSYHGTSAALEFAVTKLEVSNILVLGHGQCGGVAAALAAAKGPPVGKFIGPWVDVLSGVRDDLLARTQSADTSACQGELEHLAVQHSLANLMTFPFVASAVSEGRLTLEGAWFSIAEGQLHWLDRKSGSFEPVSV